MTVSSILRITYFQYSENEYSNKGNEIVIYLISKLYRKFFFSLFLKNENVKCKHFVILKVHLRLEK